jgi:succinate dehydrogenase / fumarate reductase membrane anchor subunit
MDRFHSPLYRARGLGSAKEGTRHWWLQRLTALALIPLSVWFASAVIALSGAGLVRLTAWMSEPWNSVLLVIMLGCAFWHSSLGVQTIIEDYVHKEGAKLSALILSLFLHILFGTAAIYAVLRISFGGTLHGV